MVNVLFDHQIFSMQRYGGISRYFANIYNSIKKENDVRSDISILRSRNHYIQDFPAPLNNFIGDILLSSNNKATKWNKVYSKYRIKKNNYDILHPTYYDPYFLKYTKKPYVITVHDMIHELYQDFFDPSDKFANYKRRCVENATHIIAISHSTKEDLINVLGVEANRISVIHHGYSPDLTLVNDPQPLVSNDYLLFVGDRKGYKNFSRFVTAMAPLLSKNRSLSLICTGGGKLQSAELELLFRLRIKDQVIQRNVSDLQLANLYANAIAFVYPSLYEGFGFPILEAFAHNCPVIASDNKCFREIGEEAVAYFDPCDIHQISTSVEGILHNTSLREELIRKGRTQLPKFSMDICMQKTLSVYKNLSNCPLS